jgi:hypothetical protein
MTSDTDNAARSSATTDKQKILLFIATTLDPEKLKTLIARARERKEIDVEKTALRRLFFISPSERPGTVEHDFWQTVHAFEFALTQERGKTTRLARTRQKVERVGVVQTLKDWALSSSATDGFQMLLDRGMPDLTGEAIVLRHPDVFDEEIRAAANQRLKDAGVDINSLSIAGSTAT